MIEMLNYSNEHSITEAIDKAKKHKSPWLLKIDTYQDDRGWSFMNIAQNFSNFGQMNFSHIHPGAIKAWHKHTYQTDLWFVVQGDLKIGIVYEGSDLKFWSTVIGEHKPGILIIPPNFWHGCVVNTSYPAGLVYLTDKTYNLTNPDEQRKPFDYFDFDWGIKNK